MKQETKNPFADSLFEQMANITKASAYDIVSNQVKELKKEKELLRSSCELALQHWGHAIMNDDTQKVINSIKEALKITAL